MRRLLCFLCMFAAVAGQLFALSDAELMKLSGRAVSKTFPDADNVLLYDRQEITFELDGTANDIDDMYYKVLTEKGAEELRSMPMHFNEFYEKYHIEKLEIIRGKNRISIDIPKNSRISVDNSQMSANIYDPSNKILFINVPGLQLNDILHLKVRRQTLRPRMKGFFTDIAVLQSDNPILYYSVQYSAPEQMPLRSIMIKDRIDGCIRSHEKKHNGRIIYSFVAENVPAVVPEPNAPPMYLFCQRVLVSSAAKWEDISKWYNDLCEGHLQKVTPQMRDFVKNLVKDCKSPQEKLRKIFDFVSQQIRYMGVTTETEAPGYEPHDVNITFEKRYGVCRDKAALLTALLRLADIPAYMTLFYAGAPKDQEVPNNYFNHAIVAAQFDGMTDYILMDPTDENSSELLPAYGANKSFLVARSGGDTLRTSPEIDAMRNRIDIENNFQIDAEGSLTGSSLICFYGINDNIYRDAFANWQQEYIRQFFNVIMNQVFPGVEINKIVISPSNIRDLRQTLSVKMNFSVKKFVNLGSSAVILPPHDLSNILGALMMQVKRADLKQRRHPMQFFSTAAVDEHTEIKFAGGKFNVRLPEYIKCSNAVFAFEKEAGFKNGVLIENSKVSIGKTVISPAEYLILRDLLQKYAAEQRKKVLLTAPDISENAERILVLSDCRTIKFIDAFSWTDTGEIKYKVLDYSGVKNYAELSVPFDSGREKVSLVYGIVRTPDGRTFNISDAEIHVMDSGITSNTPHYAAHKVFTVKFPHVVPGAVIEYKIDIERKNMPFFSDMFVFADDKDILLKRVVLENIPPQFMMSEVPFGVTVIKDKQKVILEKKNITHTDFEVRQAPLAMFKDTVYCSTVNFQEYCYELDRRMKLAASNAGNTAKLTLDLIKECKAPTEKITVIRDYVDRNIRLAGPALNQYNWTFTPADRTLELTYGNSADRAVLLKAMLDAAGLKSEFVVRSKLAYSGVINPYYVKTLRYFQDHYDRVLVFVYENDNVIAVLNENSRYAPIDQDNSKFQTGLQLSGKTPSVVSRSAAGRVDKSAVLKIKPDNSVDAEVKLTYNGTSAENLRRFLVESDSQKKKQFFEQLTTAFSRLAELRGTWKVSDENGVMKLEALLHLKNMVSFTGDIAVLELPYLSDLGDDLPVASDRRSPLWINSPAAENITLNIVMPSDWSLYSMLENTAVDRTIGNIYSFSYQIGIPQKDTVSISAFFAARPGLLDAENAAALPALKKLMQSSELNCLFFKKSTGKKK